MELIAAICSRCKHAIYLEVGRSTSLFAELNRSVDMPFPEPHRGCGRLGRGHRPLEKPLYIPLPPFYFSGISITCAIEARWPPTTGDDFAVLHGEVI